MRFLLYPGAYWQDAAAARLLEGNSFASSIIHRSTIQMFIKSLIPKDVSLCDFPGNVAFDLLEAGFLKLEVGVQAL